MRLLVLICVGVALACGCGSVKNGSTHDAAGSGSNNGNCILDQSKLGGCKL